ncbi:MAG: hypothetical protein MJB14_02170 [Spirochaetes bacterium]|nr:hypothetical protein [Spirochaetota bacterium]
MEKLDVQRIEDFIKTLGEEELVYINRLVIERLKLISQQRSTHQMARFNITERVCFEDNTGMTKKGVITKLNKKTISIKTDDGQEWNVAPGLLRHV